VNAQNNNLIMSSGTNLVVAGGSLVLNNTDLQISGTFNDANASIWLTGTNNTSITGAGTVLIQTLNLNTSPGSVFTLNNSIQISSALNFQNGIIDLNNHQIQLTGNAALQSESESSYITGISGGAVSASATSIDNPDQLNAGNLGAVLTSAANLGNLNISRSHKPAINFTNNLQHGIQRTYLIQPQNNTALNATLRFYYLNEELNGDDPSTLSLWKSTDGLNWIKIGADSRNPTEKYVEMAGLADLSYWTLTDDENPLPLTLISFKAVCDNATDILDWKTGVESDLDMFVIEKSTDGTNWFELGGLPATNNPNGFEYRYVDGSPDASSYYRLKIVDVSGGIDYSPVFKGGCSDITLPFIVYPNPATTKTTAQISLREAATGNIELFNTEGQLVYKSSWNLQPGINQIILQVSALSSGTYIVNLILKDKTLQTRFIKE
jgi:hypothetical protein